MKIYKLYMLTYLSFRALNVFSSVQLKYVDGHVITFFIRNTYTITTRVVMRWPAVRSLRDLSGRIFDLRTARLLLACYL